MVRPDFMQRTEGRDACVASYDGFCKQAAIRDFKISNPGIDVFGDTAIRALNLPTLCIAGTEEESGACLELPERPPIDVRRLPGSHHFKGDYAGLGDAVARFIETTMVTRERNRQ